MKGFLTIATIAVMATLCAVPLGAQTTQPTGRQPVDTIAAVVGDQMILMSEVRYLVQVYLMSQNVQQNLTDEQLADLFHQALDDMVNEQLLLVKAQQDSIIADLATVDDMTRQEIAQFKSRYQTEEAYLTALEGAGLTEEQYRRSVQETAYKNVITQMLLDQIQSTISVTPQELDAFVATYRDSLPEIPEQFKISHILIYPRVAGDRDAAAKAKLEEALARFYAGEDFAALAKEYSEDTSTKDVGGDLGYFSRDMFYPEFTDVVFGLQKGEISGVFETPLGYHIAQVEDIRGDQVQVRHILIRVTPDERDTQNTVELLNDIRERIVSGDVTFDEMAREYSEDESSNALGGRLQWLTPDSTIPSFIEQARLLDVGGISPPFQSEYGYHIIRLDNYRPAHKANLKDDSQYIRSLVIQQKNMTELTRVIDQLKSDIYIDIRLD